MPNLPDSNWLIPVVCVLVIAFVIVRRMDLNLRLPKKKEKPTTDDHGEEHAEDGADDHHEDGGGHGHHDHGFLHNLHGWGKSALAIFGIAVIVFLIGRYTENRMDERVERRGSVSRPPAHETRVPATATPCGPSEQKPLVLTVQPGADSPLLEPADGNTHSIGLYTPDGASYEICTADKCHESGEINDPGDWYVRNNGRTEFAMKCWLAPLPASTDN